MKLSLTDPGISRALFLTNDREREHAYILKKVTKKGDTVLDLGANIGYYALMESHLVGANGRIIAIEPHPANYELLKENITLNGCNNIIPIHAAVTDYDGSATLHVSKLSNVHSVLPSVNHAAGQTITVPSISIKTLATKHREISTIRMDIEGFETVILKSIIDINKVQAFKPSILFELHGKKYEGDTMIVLLKQLSTLGYYVKYLATSDGDRLKKVNVEPITSIPTDGKIRHIVENLDLQQTTSLIPSARCLLLSVR